MPSERTLASIRLQGEPERNGMFTQYPCGCEHRIDRRHRWRLCQYHNGFDDASARADELQALIDAHAAAESHCDYVASLQREVFDPEVQRMWDETYDALLAAATKEDDRG